MTDYELAMRYRDLLILCLDEMLKMHDIVKEDVKHIGEKRSKEIEQ